MCGITGFYSPGGFSSESATVHVCGMADAVAHRGPDDSGQWLDPEAGIALGHRRLSIVDLSPAGHQPMFSASGRYVLVLNGEIYNHARLRTELGDGWPWRGHSDTETLLAAIERWGVEPTLKKSTGMFAFALWDRSERTLTLARDRMGEKPLYYGWQGEHFLFGSGLGALRRHPSFAGVLNRDVLTLYLQHGYIPAPHSIYRGIHKLLPGTILRLSHRSKPGSPPEMTRFWSLAEAVAAGRAAPFAGGDKDAVDELERLLNDAVSLQRVADVPLGAFLSGGVDSSTVVALMQRQSSRPVKTFSIGFEESAFNEAEHASAVARHLGTDHTGFYVTHREVIESIPTIPVLYDEPLGDSSGSMLISRLARRHVTVSLSGDGGDEVFGGYDHYFRLNAIRAMSKRLPPASRRALGGLLLAMPDAVLSAMTAPVHALRRRRPELPSPQRLRQLAESLRAGDPGQAYHALRSHLDSSSRLVLGAGPPPPMPPAAAEIPSGGSFIETMMYVDGVSYLADDILVKVDRAAMWVGLETRVPILDHRVVEFAARLPLRMKIRNGEGKWVLRQVLHRHVPQAIIDRPKMGFNLPIGGWLRGPLRGWADDQLNESPLRRDGYFDSAAVRRLWDEHQSERFDRQGILWRLLAFQVWSASRPTADSTDRTSRA